MRQVVKTHAPGDSHVLRHPFLSSYATNGHYCCVMPLRRHGVVEALDQLCLLGVGWFKRKLSVEGPKRNPPPRGQMLGFLTLWHGLFGVCLVPGDQVGEVGEFQVVFEIRGQEISQDARELAI